MKTRKLIGRYEDADGSRRCRGGVQHLTRLRRSRLRLNYFLQLLFRSGTLSKGDCVQAQPAPPARFAQLSRPESCNPQPRFRSGKSKSNPRGLNQAAGTFLPAGSNAAHSPGLTTNKVFKHAFSYRKTERHPCRRRTNAGCPSARTEGGKGGSLFSAGWKGVSHLSARQQKAPGTEWDPIHGAVMHQQKLPAPVQRRGDEV